MGTPCLKITTSNPESEQSARVRRLFRLTAEAKQKGCSTARIKIQDLEALIAIAAATDARLIPSHQSRVRS